MRREIIDVHFGASSSLSLSLFLSLLTAIAMLDKEVKLVADILYVGRERTDSSCLCIGDRHHRAHRVAGWMERSFSSVSVPI